VWPTPVILAFAALFIVDLLVSYRSPLFLLISILTWPFICEGLLRALTTELTYDGVSQRTLRGRKFLAWAEVEEVSRNGGFIWIAGKGRRLLLRPGLFENPDAAREFMQRHLPAENDRLSG
jgi:hypothetical protein